MATKLSAWRDRYDAAVDRREDVISKCLKYDRFYNGDQWDGIITQYEDDQLTINYAKAIIDTIRDSTYFQNPSFLFSGCPANVELVKVINQVFPYLLRKIKYKQQTKRVLLDGLKFGFGYKYNGYSFKGDRGHDAILPDEVFSVWIPHDSVALEHDATSDVDCNYLFYSEWKTWDSVKDDPRFKFPKNYEPSGSYKPPEGREKWRYEQGMKRVELIHVFDRGEGYHRIFVEDCKDWVFKEGWTLGDCTLFPINMLRLNDDQLYPPSMLRDLMPINQEINKMESMKLNHAKRFNRKYGFNGKLTDQQRKALRSGIDGIVIEELEGQGQLWAIEDAVINEAVYRSAESLYMIMKLISRVGEYNFGVKPAGDTTATEASYVESGTAIGTSQIKDLMGDFCEKDATCLIALMKENYDAAHTFVLGEQQMVEFDRNDLVGLDNYSITVDSESSAPPLAIERKQEAVAMMNMFAQDPFVNSLELRKNVMNTFKTVPNPAKLLNSPQTLQVIAQSLQGGGNQFNEAAIQQYLSSPNPNTAEMSQDAGNQMPGAEPLGT